MEIQQATQASVRVGGAFWLKWVLASGLSSEGTEEIPKVIDPQETKYLLCLLE